MSCDLGAVPWSSTAVQVGFKLDPSMFSTPEKEQLPLDRCMRILPHHQVRPRRLRRSNAPDPDPGLSQAAFAPAAVSRAVRACGTLEWLQRRLCSSRMLLGDACLPL